MSDDLVDHIASETGWTRSMVVEHAIDSFALIQQLKGHIESFPTPEHREFVVDKIQRGPKQMRNLFTKK